MVHKKNDLCWAITNRQKTKVNDMSDKAIEYLRVLYLACIDYVEYRHDGDPWSEDRRAMGEMDLDDLKRDGTLEEINQFLNKEERDT